MVVRLLWKEFRESWLIVLIAVALPPAFLRLARTIPFPMTPDAIDLIRYIGVLGSSAALMLWAIRKGSRRREEFKSPLAHLPAHPVLEKAISIVIPLAISAIIGLWIGNYVPTHGRLGQYVPTSPIATAMIHREMQETAIRFAALYASAAFAGCFLIAAVWSTWAGLLAGFVWGIVGLDWIIALPDIQSSQMGREAWMSFFCRTAAGAAFCLALFLLLRGRQLRASSIIAMASLAIIMFAPMAYDQFIAPSPGDYFGDIMYSADRSLVLKASVDHVLTLTDRRTGRSVIRHFRGDLGLIGFDNAGYAYTIRQDIGSSRAGITRWDGHTTKLLAMVPAAKRSVLGSGSYHNGSISPDRRYLAFPLRSGLGRGMDLWIINLRTASAWIALPNGWFGLTSARWLQDRLVLPDSPGILTVDLITRKTGTLKIPGQDGS